MLTCIVSALCRAAYEAYLQQQLSFFARWQAAYSLGNAIAPQHPLALSMLRDLIREADNTLLKIRLCERLARVNPGDEIAVSTLRQILQTTEEDGFRRKAAHCLIRICQDETAIAILEHLAQAAEQPIQHQAAASLAQLIPNHPLAKASPRSPKRQRSRSERSSASITQEIESLVKKLQNPSSLYSQIRLAHRLGRMLPGHLQAIQSLMAILQQPQHEASLYRWVAEGLVEILTEERMKEAIAPLHALLPLLNGAYTPQSAAAYGILWHIAQSLSYDSFKTAIEDLKLAQNQDL
jgi:HEAT repeat protein